MMKKNAFIFAIACSFFMCLEMYSMCYECDYCSESDKIYTTKGLATIALVEGKDPYRFGDLKTDIELSQEDSKALAFFKKHNIAFSYETDQNIHYPRARNLLAIILHEYDEKKNKPAIRDDILRKAFSYRDFHLANLALQKGACATTEDDTGYPLIQTATSLVMLNLLLTHGAELQIDRCGGASMIHRACNPDYDPEVLAVYLTAFPDHVNRASANQGFFLGETPLEKTAFVDVSEKTDFAKLFQKLSLLIRAGATFSGESKSGINALYYIRKKINDNIEIAMNRPMDSKEAPEYVLQASLYKKIEKLLLAQSLKSKENENEKS